MKRLEAHELYRFFHNGEAETFALRGVSLCLKAGEFVALVGPSGSGKSTLLACLSGVDTPDGGMVTLEGEHVTRRPEWQRASLRARYLGLLMQSGNLVEHLSVDDNIHLQTKLAKARDTTDWPSRLGVADRRHAFPFQLSGGEAARAGLAVALAAGAQVLICDEPTAEVDSESENVVLSILKQRRDAGAAVLVATHSQALASGADRVIAIEDGRLV